MNTAHHRIKQILEEFASATTISGDLIREFREWFFGNGHLDEKLDSFHTLLESNIRFEPNPGHEVHEAYEKIAAKLGFEKSASIENPTQNNTRFRRGALLRIAAVLIPVVTLVGLLFHLLHRAEPVEQLMAAAEITLSVPKGEKKYATLPDGSSVWINGGSELVYKDNFDEERSVILSGEAFFTVNKAEGKPFTVTSQGLKVTVLGTVFDIATDSEGKTTTVSLYEGALRVDAPDASIRLTKGQKLEHNLVTGSVSVKDIARTGPDWMSNNINYHQVPVADVLTSLGNIYGYDIEATATGLPGDIITLRFEDETSLEEVLSILSEMCGFKYRIHGKTVYITK